MSPECTAKLGGLIVSLCCAGAAMGQYPSTSPYSSSSGGYSGSTASAPSALNQMALRNAQAILQNSLQQPAGGMQGGGRIGLGIGESTSGSKPFAGYSLGPTVSPYLNLFRVDQNGQSAFNYSTLVEPQLQQQQINKQQQLQNQQTSRRIQAIAASPDFNPQGARDEAPTGHQTAFMYYGHYYQPPVKHQKRVR